jgi:4-coumarate--CoA ligase
MKRLVIYGPGVLLPEIYDFYAFKSNVFDFDHPVFPASATLSLLSVNMALHSRWSQPIPKCSLQQWIFGSSNGPMEDADKSILIDADRPDTHFLTKSQFRLLSKQVALGLIKNGVQPQSRVLVFSANNVYFPSVFLGILMAGGVFTGANPSFTPRELAYQLKNSEATHMFVHAGQLLTALEAAGEVGLKKENIFVLDPSVPPPVGPNSALPAARKDGLRLWTELLADTHEEAKTWQWTEPQDAETAACCLNYSSGTTGVPKGVEITHFSYVANGAGVVMMSDLEPDPEHRKNAKGLAFLPMYHAYAQTYYISIYPKVCIPAYIMPSFDFEKMLQHIQRFRITTLLCVPPILVYLSKHQR